MDNKPNKDDAIPTKCSKCGSQELDHDEFSMHGNLGFMGPAYRFDVYICKECGFSQFFFQSAKWIM